jgi:hypothetical protein
VASKEFVRSDWGAWNPYLRTAPGGGTPVLPGRFSDRLLRVLQINADRRAGPDITDARNS